MKLDAIDRRILRALQRNGRLQNIELAEEVGLSPYPACGGFACLSKRV
jgi:DNA-binding Lrp family transcriptional regulator